MCSDNPVGEAIAQQFFDKERAGRFRCLAIDKQNNRHELPVDYSSDQLPDRFGWAVDTPWRRQQSWRLVTLLTVYQIAINQIGAGVLSPAEPICSERRPKDW